VETEKGVELDGLEGKEIIKVSAKTLK